MRPGLSDPVHPVRPLDDLRAHAAGNRLGELREAGVADARLYGDDARDGVGGLGAFFLLLDDPEVYGLPPDPGVIDSRPPGKMWKTAAVAAMALVGSRSGGLRPRQSMSAPQPISTEPRSYYGRRPS